MRALFSVYDKTGLVDFAKGLVSLGWDLVASGGTSRALSDAGIPFTEIQDVTGFPEMLDGRVKTLHPKIHGGILANRDNPQHMEAIASHGIDAIDLVVCNLYPFDSQPGIEMIDIGGPSMLRAAAKNHAHVGVVVHPGDYGSVLEEIRVSGSLGDATRRRLARAAFDHTSSYDAAIVDWFDRRDATNEDLPSMLNLALTKAEDLRYGENPHQRGARYRENGATGWWDTVKQHSGIPLSFLNIFDADAAWRLVHELSDRPAKAAAVIVKHANPCGAAVGNDIADTYRRAFECDPVSAFGGIVALNRAVDDAMADEIASNPKADVLIAPSYTDGALALFATKKKNLRVLEAAAPAGKRLELRRIDGGFLVQVPDRVEVARDSWQVVTKAQPTEEQWSDIDLAWKVCAAVASNAVVVVNDGQATGIGAGQQNRLDSAGIAVRKAGDAAKGGVCASDAFFPFRDGLDVVAAAGVSVVVQPGGFMRDDEVIAAADEHGIVMIFTGQRHFRH